MAFIALVYSLISPESEIHSKFALVLIGTVVTTISLPSYIIKQDLTDGSLENMIVSLEISTILMIKYFALLTSISLGFLITMPIITLFYGFNIHETLYISTLSLLIIIQGSALVLLANIVHAYFRKNTNLILSLIIPILIPSIIISSMAIMNNKPDFLYIILGIDLIMVPIMLAFSNYLLKNIYNF
jgi:heme exporter protein B